MSDNFIVFGAAAIGQEEIDEVVDSLRSGWLGTGPKVARFERDFARYKAVPEGHATALNSCTAGLHLSLLSLGLEPGDEVITTPLTFCATVNTILHAGLKPVLADIDPVSLTIDPTAIEAAITPRTRALLPVHCTGHPCAMDRIMTIAQRHDLKVVEDCAHAIETTFDGRPAGSFGDFGCFSFYVTKNVACGEGGMVIGQDAAAIQRIKRLALHGMDNDAWKRFGGAGYRSYAVVECGYKYNMMDLQAAIGIHQLAGVERHWQQRRDLWERYQEAFRYLPVTTPAPLAERHRHGYHLYTLLINPDASGISREDFIAGMTARKIGVGIHYLSLPEHPYYQEALGWRPEDYPNALRVGRQTVSLPCTPYLAPDEVDHVIDSVRALIPGPSH